MRCIVCLEERAPSKEHVIPLALGGTVEIERVCASCNSMLGNLADSHLTNHPFAILRRHEFSIRDRSGTIPDPFSSFLEFGVDADDPRAKLKIQRDTRTGALGAQRVFQELPPILDRGPPIRRVVMDLGDAHRHLPRLIERERSRAGLPPITRQEMTEQILSLTSNVSERIDVPVQYEIRVDTRLFGLALCKIAYECTWMALGDDYLGEAEALLIPKRIRDKDLSDVCMHASLCEGPCFHWWASDEASHICYIIADPAKNEIFAFVRIFAIFFGVFRTSRSIDLSRRLVASGGFFLIVDPRVGDSRQTTFAEAIRDIQT